MRLRAHHNVVDLAAERRAREPAVQFQFVDWVEAAPSPSHPAAQALLGGPMQGMGEWEKDEALLDTGKKLGEAARERRPDASGWLWWVNRILASLGLGRY